MRIIVTILFYLFFVSQFLYSYPINSFFKVKFGEKTNYEGYFIPMIFNTSLKSLYDNGTKFKCNCVVLGFEVKVLSENFNPNESNIFVKLNDNITINLNYFYLNSNAFPDYKNSFNFYERIFPQDIGFEFSQEDFKKMIDWIDNVTFVFNYKGKTYKYIIEDFSKYRDFLKTRLDVIENVDTSEFPKISWTLKNNNFSYIGVCLYPGDNIMWNYAFYPNYRKVNYNSKIYFGKIYDSNDITSLDFSKIKDLWLPVKLYLAKIKAIDKMDNNPEIIDSNIFRLEVFYRKIPKDKEIAISNLTGWQLLGAEDDIFISSISKVFDKEKINTIWKWGEGKWEVWSPDTNMMNLINNYKLKKITIIPCRKGFWVNFKK